MNELEQLYQWLQIKEHDERKHSYYSGKQFDLGYASACMDIFLHVKEILDKQDQ